MRIVLRPCTGIDASWRRVKSLHTCPLDVIASPLTLGEWLHLVTFDGQPSVRDANPWGQPARWRSARCATTVECIQGRRTTQDQSLCRRTARIYLIISSNITKSYVSRLQLIYYKSFLDLSLGEWCSRSLSLWCKTYEAHGGELKLNSHYIIISYEIIFSL